MRRELSIKVLRYSLWFSVAMSPLCGVCLFKNQSASIYLFLQWLRVHGRDKSIMLLLYRATIKSIICYGITTCNRAFVQYLTLCLLLGECAILLNLRCWTLNCSLIVHIYVEERCFCEACVFSNDTDKFLRCSYFTINISK